MTESKNCPKCDRTLELTCFHKNARKKDKLDIYCKQCSAAYKKAWRLANPEKEKEKSRAYYLKHKAAVIARTREWAKRNPEKVRKASDEWLARNPDKARIVQQQWRARNPDKASAWAKNNREKRQTWEAEYRLRNIDKLNVKRRKWRLENLHKDAAKSSRRRASKKNAQPTWLTCDHKTQILLFYETARAYSSMLGTHFHVDHIVPINGENVCGLHVPWNLQILDAEANIKKQNKMLSESNMLAGRAIA